MALSKLHALELFLKFDVAHHFVITFPFNWVFLDQAPLYRNCLNQTIIYFTKLLINVSQFVDIVSRSVTAIINNVNSKLHRKDCC